LLLGRLPRADDEGFYLEFVPLLEDNEKPFIAILGAADEEPDSSLEGDILWGTEVWVVADGG